MSSPIIYIDKSEIREGKFEQINRSIKDLSEFVKENVPQLIYYGFFINEELTQMTVVAVHPNSESIEYHLDVGKKEFRKFADLLDLLKIEVYGKVSDPVYKRLRQKAQMLGNATVTVHDFNAGFYREQR